MMEEEEEEEEEEGEFNQRYETLFHSIKDMVLLLVTARCLSDFGL